MHSHCMLLPGRALDRGRCTPRRTPLSGAAICRAPSQVLVPVPVQVLVQVQVQVRVRALG